MMQSLLLTEDNLQKLLSQFMSCHKHNMKISVGKTKTMNVSKEFIRCKLELQGKIIEQVMRFNY